MKSDHEQMGILVALRNDGDPISVYRLPGGRLAETLNLLQPCHEDVKTVEQPRQPSARYDLSSTA